MKAEEKKKLLSDFFKFFIEKGEMTCDGKTVDYFVSAFLNESPLSDSPEEINCPWCEGKGWVIETDIDEQGEPEPAQYPCRVCDLTGRITTAQINAHFDRMKSLEKQHDDDLPF